LASVTRILLDWPARWSREQAFFRLVKTKSNACAKKHQDNQDPAGPGPANLCNMLILRHSKKWKIPKDALSGSGKAGGKQALLPAKSGRFAPQGHFTPKQEDAHGYANPRNHAMKNNRRA
jgi:hypothetical protein